jgi:hypothetical protein
MAQNQLCHLRLMGAMKMSKEELMEAMKRSTELIETIKMSKELIAMKRSNKVMEAMKMRRN